MAGGLELLDQVGSVGIDVIGGFEARAAARRAGLVFVRSLFLIFVFVGLIRFIRPVDPFGRFKLGRCGAFLGRGLPGGLRRTLIALAAVLGAAWPGSAIVAARPLAAFAGSATSTAVAAVAALRSIEATRALGSHGSVVTGGFPFTHQVGRRGGPNGKVVDLGDRFTAQRSAGGRRGAGFVAAHPRVEAGDLPGRRG